MAALTNTQISVTYVGLLKTSANTVLSATAQQITDGSGNNTIHVSINCRSWNRWYLQQQVKN